MQKTKTCTKCGRELPATTEYFNRDKRAKYGLRAQCKWCHSKGSAVPKKAKLKDYDIDNVLDKRSKDSDWLYVWNEYLDKVKTKACSKCKRKLPLNKYYYPRRKKQGVWTFEGTICKECLKDSRRFVKQCTGCGRFLPADVAFFKYNPSGGESVGKLNSKCRQCQGEDFTHIGVKQCVSCGKAKPDSGDFFPTSPWTNNQTRRGVCLECIRNQARQSQQKRISKKKRAVATLTSREYQKTLEYFNNSCAYCGMTEKEHIKEFEQTLHQEHFIPLSEGGGYTHNNIIPACKSCNSSKQEKDFFEWYPEQEFYSKEREKKILIYLGYIEKGVYYG